MSYFDEKTEKILSKDVLGHVLENVKKGKVSESHVKEILGKIARGESHEEAVKVKKIDMRGIEEKVMNLVKAKPGLSEKAYMGLIMKDTEFKGKVSGKEVMEIIKRFVG